MSVPGVRWFVVVLVLTACGGRAEFDGVEGRNPDAAGGASTGGALGGAGAGGAFAGSAGSTALGGGGTTAAGGDADAGGPVECPAASPSGVQPTIDGEECANVDTSCIIGCEFDCFCMAMGDATKWHCFGLGCK